MKDCSKCKRKFEDIVWEFDCPTCKLEGMTDFLKETMDLLIKVEERLITASAAILCLIDRYRKEEDEREKIQRDSH